ncbi:hypothetical protein B0T18DRAFT_394300 [Schizothecium vesticola]|uniref:L-ornithine N(5)-oxygenase n=1 Tax=Schizothecium vesticola TaxID=314040 RepID=A0AA40BP66_9PEZI|nr:hypothetical protein B0T18DRAFT_394300 [Schizothecium vesticola]
MSAPTTPPPRPPSYTQFACIGAGFSGICLGATLRRWHNITSLRLFDASPSLGGTWFLNRYPGAACDVPSALYSYSFAPNPRWTRILATGPELHAYLVRVAADYDLLDKMSFRSAVERAEWHEERARWVLTVRDLDADATFTHECQFLFSGTGHFSKPRELDVPGLENFRGVAMHSARWRDEVELEGKKVVVFGNGCTATQIVPALVKLGVERVTQIVRAKHWIMPPVDETVPRWAREVLQWMPGMLALQRFIVFCVAEIAYLSFPVRNRRFRSWNQSRSEAYMKATAPEKYWGMLIPDFEFGCKRRVFDTGYLEALDRENVILTDEPAVEVVENGVRLRSGEVVDADIIVLANGFEMNELLEGVEVVGVGGETLHGKWEKIGGLGAYKTFCVAGFPNFYLLLGPNSATAHTSNVIWIENAVNHSLRVIKPLLEGQASVAEVKPEAEEAYIDKVQGGLQKMIWSSPQCQSWYNKELDAPVEVAGKKTQRWNGMLYPWSSGHFWWACLFPSKADWVFRGPPTKSTIAKRRSSKTWLAFFTAIALSGVAVSRWTDGHPESSFSVAVTAVLGKLIGSLHGSGLTLGAW